MPYVRTSQKRLTLLATLLPLLLLGASSPTGDKDVKVPFLFAEDDKLPQAELRESIARSHALQADQFLNGPMTRLEYMLTRLESRLNEDLQTGYIHDRLAEAFDRGNVAPTISGFAFYDVEAGRLSVGYRIEALGRPRKPLKSTCDELLTELKIRAPQELLGYTYHNTVLGVLAQKPYSEYTSSLELLANNLVHRVRLQSTAADYRTVHGLACQRNEKDAPVLYHRFSFRVGS